MQITLAWILLKTVTFATSTFSKIQTFYINLLFAMDASLCAISLTDFKIIPVKGKTYRVVSNLLYSKRYHLLESSSSIDKFGSL